MVGHKVSYYTFFDSQPESIHTDRAVVDKMIGWPILDLFHLLHLRMTENSNVFKKAKDIVVKTWGDTTTKDEREAVLKKIGHEDVSQTMFVLAHVVLCMSPF